MSILEAVKASQQQNGLRHGNYRRYRQYCTRRLRCIRTNKAVRFMYGKGKQYMQKDVTPEIATDERHLQIPLVNAERAWSYAMELQQASEEEPRKRHHQKRRLEKAAAWGVKLRDLCAVRADDRTALEAEAYSAWMSGTMMMQRDAWKEALAHFLTCKRIYEQLGVVATPVQRDLFAERVEELEHSIQYCEYTISVGAGEDDDAALLEMRLKGGGKGGGSDLLQAKLDSVLAESRKKQATTLESVDWQGQQVALRSSDVRLALLKARDMAFELEHMAAGDEGDKREDLYLDIGSAYDEAIKQVRADLNKVGDKGGDATEAARKELRLLEAYVRSLKLDKQTERYSAMAAHLAKQYDAGSSTGEEKKGDAAQDNAAAGSAASAVTPRPEDLVRVYDTLVQNMNELRDLPGADDDSALTHCASARGFVFTALRCFFISETYAVSDKWTEANALVARTLDFIAQADEKMEVIACKPLLFDTAFNVIRYPDFSERAKASGGGGGFFSGWFSGR
eukprot:g3481.t1